MNLIAGVFFDAPDSEALGGKSFVVTGTLEKYTRDQIHSMIERNGGKVSKSVSSKTNFLVAGEKAGSKREKAEKLGVTILTELEFEKLVKENEPPVETP